MTDKEVGELWRSANAAIDNGHSALWAKAVIDLIHNLVEEREAFYEVSVAVAKSGHTRETLDRWKRTNALRDFGIDPEDFKGD